MPPRERLESLKDQLRDKTRRLVMHGPASSTNSLVNDPSPSLSPMPESSKLPTPAASATAPVPTPLSSKPTVGDHPWTHLRRFLQVLAKSSNGLGLLKSSMEDLARCIALHEDAAVACRDYEALKTDLEALFNILSTQFAGDVPPSMTASMDSLCGAIERELGGISTKKKGWIGGRLREAQKDMDGVMRCYRRIQGHLERLSLNADLNTWKLVDKLATDVALDKLKPSMSASYNSREATQVRRRECTPNTRKEVLSELNGWRHDRGQGNIFWLNGMAGTGKTTIATSLCSMLELTYELGASFFCTRQLPECRNVHLILPTIAFQLACFSRPFRYALSRVLERDPNVHTKALPAQLEGLIIRPLREVAETLPEDLIVVIDALDECEDNEGVGQILELLLEHASELPIKVFVSSRPEPQFRQKIGRMKSQLVLHELDDKIVKGDIEIYLRAELRGISVSQSQLANLVERAGVLFIYAATAVRYIRAKNFHSGQQERLNHVLSALPTAASSNKNKEIDALYTVVLASAFNSPELEESDQDRMRLVLRTVVCAQQPLTVNALAGLLQLGDGGWVYDAIEPLWSVLYVSELGADSLVTTLHASFPDYMLDQKRSKEYCCYPKSHHGQLAELCFARIQSNKRQFNICELESSYVLDEQVWDLEQRVKRAIPLDLEYACRYWAVHLELGESSNKRVDMLDDFMSRRLLLWMEVLNLGKWMNVVPSLLEKARKWCKSQLDESITEALVNDAWRFATTFAANTVSRSTPHLYVSMLASWPNSSPIAQRYSRRTKQLVNVTGAAMEKRELALIGIIASGTGIRSVAFSPDGMRIVSGCDNKTIQVWDAQNGKMVLGPLVGHTRPVRSVAFSPDGIRLVSGSDDGTLRVWDAQSGETVLGPLAMALRPLEMYTATQDTIFITHSLTRPTIPSVNSVGFSPDGMRIVAGSDETVRVWDVQSGKVVLELPKGEHQRNGVARHHVNWVAFSPDGLCIAFGSNYGTISVMHTESGQIVLGPLLGHTRSVNSVVFSPDGVRLVSGSSDQTLRVWDARDGQMVLGPLEGHTASVNSVMFSPDGTRFVSGSTDGTIRVWDMQTGEMVLGPLKGHTASVTSVAFLPDGMRIISGSDDMTLRVWNAQSEQMVPGPFEGDTHSVYSVAFSPDGQRVASGSGDKTIRVWDAQSGKMVLGPLQGHTRWVSSVVFSPDSTCIASGSGDNTIRVWDSRSGLMVSGPLKGHTDSVSSVAFSSDGVHLVSGSHDHDIRLWHMQSQQMVLEPLEGHTDPVNSVAFSPDGKCIVSGSSDKTIRVWDSQSGNLVLGPLEGHTDSITSITFSPTGTHILSGSRDKTIRLWDTRSGQMVMEPFQGHTGLVNSVAFSPNGKYIVSGSWDNTIRVWDLQNGQVVLGPLKGHTSSVNSVAVSPDGLRIISGSDDKRIRGWPLTLPLIHPAISTSSIQHTRDPASTSITPSPWRLNPDGWVIDKDQHMLLWIPHDLRDRLLIPPSAFMIPTSARGSVQLTFDCAHIGQSWKKCFLPVGL